MKKERYKKYTSEIQEKKKATYGNLLDEETRQKLQEIMERNEIQYARNALKYCIDAVWWDQIGSVNE